MDWWSWQLMGYIENYAKSKSPLRVILSGDKKEENKKA